MRLDHIAYRVRDRHKTAEFFQKAFGYHVQAEFDIPFPDGTAARCIALEPPEKPPETVMPWTVGLSEHFFADAYHLPPEVFVSDGDPDSIVGRWVAARGGVGGIHHLAYQVEDVQAKMDEWTAKGYAEFSSDKPMTCPEITQAFSKPSALLGVIVEFISRGAHGFCQKNVMNLMESTKDY